MSFLLARLDFRVHFLEEGRPRAWLSGIMRSAGKGPAPKAAPRPGPTSYGL